MDTERHRMTVTETPTGLCESCRELKPAAYRDPVGREYCLDCLPSLPVPTVQRIVSYMVDSIPFEVGDKVECRTAGVLYDGIGTIKQISMDPENFGTPAYPSFYVEIEEKAYPEAPEGAWYMERQLKAVHQSDD